MSDLEDIRSEAGFRDADNQPAYIYTPQDSDNLQSTRPTKRRRIEQQESHTKPSSKFESLLNGAESPECVEARKLLYERAWSTTEAQIKLILDDSNEDTLKNVTHFVHESHNDTATHASDTIPAGFIITGPNIASQGHLFTQLSNHLRNEINGPVVVLRSGDASNLKAILKKIIRDGTSQTSHPDGDDDVLIGPSGQKLMNYDLEILHGFVKAQGSQAIVVAFQDSEAFDISLIADLVTLMTSWVDRIPFVLLFGIATSLELFQKRLPRSVTRVLNGAQFDVEHTSSLVERIFKKAIAGGRSPLRLGTTLLGSLVERQQEHVQTVQSITAALKYAYMCHFYGNALSVYTPVPGVPRPSVQPEHLEAVRMLPSFKCLIGTLVDTHNLDKAEGLLKHDATIEAEIESALSSDYALHLVRTMHIVVVASPEPVSVIDAYMTVFEGDFNDSVLGERIFESIKRMTADVLADFIHKIRNAIEIGDADMDLDGWAEDDHDFLGQLAEIQSQVSSLAKEGQKSGKPARSTYTIRNQGLRTTVIAQRVQLSYEDSTLTKQDKEFTTLVDKLLELLKQYFLTESLQDVFLHEVWLYDSMLPYRDVFIPTPRAAIERALSTPYDYLQCECCDPEEGLSSTHPATAILYQMYLETGSLINIFDLWSAFYEMASGGDEQKMDERDALILFYNGLADLKALGMVKQSKKKVDHLAKTVWKGL